MSLVWNHASPVSISNRIAANCQTVVGPAMYLPFIVNSGGAYAKVPTIDQREGDRKKQKMRNRQRFYSQMNEKQDNKTGWLYQ